MAPLLVVHPAHVEVVAPQPSLAGHSTEGGERPEERHGQDARQRRAQDARAPRLGERPNEESQSPCQTDEAQVARVGLRIGGQRRAEPGERRDPE